MNLIFRPKIKLDIRNHNIVVCKRDVDSHVSYPCVFMTFPQDVDVQISSIKINNETLMCMLSRNEIFSKQGQGSKNQVIIKNNIIMPFISENWLDLCQQGRILTFKAHKTEVFPLIVNKSMSHWVFSVKENPKVFRPKSKVVVSLDVNGHSYDYGLPLMKCSKVIIDNLVHSI